MTASRRVVNDLDGSEGAAWARASTPGWACLAQAKEADEPMQRMPANARSKAEDPWVREPLSGKLPWASQSSHASRAEQIRRMQPQTETPEAAANKKKGGMSAKLGMGWG